MNKLQYIIRKNQYLKFFTKLALLFVIVFVFDFAIGNMLRYLYFRQDNGLQYRTTYAIEETTADLLVFGSSRANHHYYPEAFETGLNMSCYNAGRDGSHISYHYAVLQSVLKRYTPRVVILDFMKGEFANEAGSYDRLASLLPYYKNHPELRPIIELKGKYERYKLLSQIYPFNSSLFTIAVGNTEMNKSRFEDINGYVPLNGQWASSITRSTPAVYDADPVKVDLYRRFIDDCKAAGVQLYIVCSPTFEHEESDDTSVEIARQIADDKKIAFIDFTNDPKFQNSQFFADINHLNNEGAIRFSKILVSDLINGIPAGVASAAHRQRVIPRDELLSRARR